MRKVMIGAVLAGAALTACSVRDGNEAQPTETTTTTTETTGVAHEEVAPPPAAPTPVAAAPAIQTQPGPENNQVALNKATVTGDILTVALTYSGSANCCVRADLDDISLIDDATSQRISILKDNAGKYMAAPLNDSGDQIYLSDFRTPSQVWFKFPAPPATSKTVSLTIPGVAPFDAVPVTR